MNTTIHHGDCAFHRCGIHGCVDPRYDCPSCPPPLDAGTCDTAQRGEPIHRKYEVHKIGDLRGKHDGCRYFVLDLDHDESARAALRTYAHAIRDNNPDFAKELDKMVEEAA